MAVIESKEQDKRTQLYRRVFNTPDGREALADMMVALDVFSSIQPADHEKAALRNYGLSILYDLGVLVDRNLPSIIDRMMDMEYISNEAPVKGKE